jgi:hypothetical protein
MSLVSSAFSPLYKAHDPVLRAPCGHQTYNYFSLLVEVARTCREPFEAWMFCPLQPLLILVMKGTFLLGVLTTLLYSGGSQPVGHHPFGVVKQPFLRGCISDILHVRFFNSTVNSSNILVVK